MITDDPLPVLGPDPESNHPPRIVKVTPDTMAVLPFSLRTGCAQKLSVDIIEDQDVDDLLMARWYLVSLADSDAISPVFKHAQPIPGQNTPERTGSSFTFDTEKENVLPGHYTIHVVVSDGFVEDTSEPTVKEGYGSDRHSWTVEVTSECGVLAQ